MRASRRLNKTKRARVKKVQRKRSGRATLMPMPIAMAQMMPMRVEGAAMP
jgi:hypothetical protein